MNEIHRKLRDAFYSKGTALDRKRKTVKPMNKTSFSIDDVKVIEKYLGRKIHIRKGRLTERDGTRITSSLKGDFALLHKARTKR